MKRARVALLSLVFAICMGVTLISPLYPPAPAQAQDPTLLYLDSLKKLRESELAATQQAVRDATATAKAIDLATAVSIEATATAQYSATRAAQAAATATARIAQTAQAEATGTTQATQTQIAATATQEAINWSENQQRKAEEERLAAEARQRLISQIRQGVFVLGGLALVIIAGGAGWLLLAQARRMWQQAHPIVVQVAGPAVARPPADSEEGRPLTQEEIAEIRVPPPIISHDPDLAQTIFENLTHGVTEAAK